MFLQFRLQSPSDLPYVDLAAVQGIRYTTLDCLPRGNVSLTLAESPPGLKDYSDVELPANAACVYCFLCGWGGNIVDEVAWASCRQRCPSSLLLSSVSKI